jgi:hypothetical protein
MTRSWAQIDISYHFFVGAPSLSYQQVCKIHRVVEIYIRAFLIHDASTYFHNLQSLELLTYSVCGHLHF